MNNKKNLLIIGSIVIVLGLICYISNFEKEDVNDNATNITENQIATGNTTNITDIQEEKYYEADETINKYITLFNSMNPDNKITTDMLSVYHHHGSDHENQVKLVLEDLPIIITANYKNNISINIDNSNDDNIVIKSLIKKFVRVFNSSITNENIDQYIDSQSAGSNIDTYDNIEYWTNKDGNGDRIIYIKITGKLEQ